MTSKPPYVIPTMTEARARPKNGLRVASLFSGAGGSSLGYLLAGYTVVYANEFIPAAADVYRANFPTTFLDTRDVRTITGAEIVARAGPIDVLDGSPPCASFSSAGRREASWGKERDYSGMRQRVDDLFSEYIRILGELQPRAFIAENVSGLVKGVAKGYFKDILGAMEEAGYCVRAAVCDAQWLGVPQVRKRLIFIGIRSDLAITPSHPAPLPYQYTIADVLPHIVRVKFAGKPENWHAPNRPAGTVVQSGAKVSPTGYFSMNLCESRDDPSPENHRPSQLPEGVRQWRIDELKRLCSFPADFLLSGTFEQQWERLGRAVPPLMMERIATHLATLLPPPSGICPANTGVLTRA